MRVEWQERFQQAANAYKAYAEDVTQVEVARAEAAQRAQGMAQLGQTQAVLQRTTERLHHQSARLQNTQDEANAALLEQRHKLIEEAEQAIEVQKQTIVQEAQDHVAMRSDAVITEAEQAIV